jgi:hypothetical protein
LHETVIERNVEFLETEEEPENNDIRRATTGPVLTEGFLQQVFDARLEYPEPNDATAIENPMLAAMARNTDM